MAIRFTDSSARHGISQEDAVRAMLHAVGSEDVPGEKGEVTIAFVGHPHPQTERYIEVIAAHRGSDIQVFHAMPLTDKYRHLTRGK